MAQTGMKNPDVFLLPTGGSLVKGQLTKLIEGKLQGSALTQAPSKALPLLSD